MFISLLCKPIISLIKLATALSTDIMLIVTITRHDPAAPAILAELNFF